MRSPGRFRSACKAWSLGLLVCCAGATASAANCIVSKGAAAAELAALRASCQSDGCAGVWRPSEQHAPATCDLGETLPRLLDVIRAAPPPTIVILGEVHDNPHHHRLRAALLSDMARRDATPVVEHFPETEQTRIDSYLAAHPDRGAIDAAAFLVATGWRDLGWPDAAMFAPLYAELLRQKPALVAANAPSSTARALARGTSGAVPDQTRRSLRLDEPLPTDQHDALLSELEASHCGMIPKTAFGGMAAAQRYRNANMASHAIAAARKSGLAVVITGNGHARRDRGIPFEIERLAPRFNVISIGFLEAPRAVGRTEPYDWAIVTPAATRADPCEEMRRRRPKPSPPPSGK